MATKGERPHIVIQPRDVAVLTALADCRVATLAQLASLHFADRREAAKKRLRGLTIAGYVARRPLPHLRFAAFVLTQRGLATADVGADSPSRRSGTLGSPVRHAIGPLKVRHDLEVGTVRGAIIGDAESRRDLQIVDLCTRPERLAFEARGRDGRVARVKPDGYVHWHDAGTKDGTGHRRCFIEVDRSTESLGVLVDRAARYAEYYRTGGFAVRMGALVADFKRHPFRVLIVCQTAERRNNLAEWLARSGSAYLGQVWVTTVNDCERGFFGPVWVTPRDYRDAVRGTPYDLDRAARIGAYRTDPERQKLVEERIAKRELADGPDRAE